MVNAVIGGSSRAQFAVWVGLANIWANWIGGVNLAVNNRGASWVFWVGLTVPHWNLTLWIFWVDDTNLRAGDIIGCGSTVNWWQALKSFWMQGAELGTGWVCWVGTAVNWRNNGLANWVQWVNHTKLRTGWILWSNAAIKRWERSCNGWSDWSC